MPAHMPSWHASSGGSGLHDRQAAGATQPGASQPGARRNGVCVYWHHPLARQFNALHWGHTTAMSHGTACCCGRRDVCGVPEQPVGHDACVVYEEAVCDPLDVQGLVRRAGGRRVRPATHALAHTHTHAAPRHVTIWLHMWPTALNTCV